jgi:hypothetical protein
VHSLTPTEVVLIEFLHKELIKDHYQFTSNKFFRNKLMAIFLLFMPDFHYHNQETVETYTLGNILKPKQWYINGLNWFRLIRAVESKERMQL